MTGAPILRLARLLECGDPTAALALALRRLVPRAPTCGCWSTFPERRTWHRCTCVGSHESILRLARLLECGAVRVGVPEAGGVRTESPPLTPTRLVRQSPDTTDDGSRG